MTNPKVYTLFQLGMLARLQVTLKHAFMTGGKKINLVHYFFQMALHTYSGPSQGGGWGGFSPPNIWQIS